MIFVLIPLMPKGVEHTRNQIKEDTGLNVLIPLMPKGVEHFCRRTKSSV